ncbi:MAG: ATP-binding cassette domain-containing protein [Ignavibacteriae bacterium]|nr:ATP-binding cassette domain-containing protein [Ignavibacteriota bacterium]NOG98355.1 ATP-binding cassette domain-containing protein [Ignavibacteriota bacterium]
MLKLNKVGFKYESSPDLIFKDISIQFSKCWTGIIGANGSGKTTLLMLASNSLKPSEGNVKSIGSSYYCEQRTDNKPHLYEGFINSYENYSFQIQELLKINTDLFSRWETLSHGERKKCQLATALFHNPDILIIDEPTNHMDLPSINCVEDTLVDFRGALLLVSHDQTFLNRIINKTWNITELDYTQLQLKII